MSAVLNNSSSFLLFPKIKLALLFGLGSSYGIFNVFFILGDKMSEE